jgi:hypothetical protein
MKDYHDLICLIQSEVVKIDLLRAAIKETFSNRKTGLRFIAFESSDVEKIQTYWTLYYDNLADETKEGLSNSIEKNVAEINEFLFHHNLVPSP